MFKHKKLLFYIPQKEKCKTHFIMDGFLLLTIILINIVVVLISNSTSYKYILQFSNNLYFFLRSLNFKNEKKKSNLTISKQNQKTLMLL